MQYKSLSSTRSSSPPATIKYLCTAFAQLTCRESLHDIEYRLRAQKGTIYKHGPRSPVSRSNLANAIKVRDWRIYSDLAYSLDAATIGLCLSEAAMTQAPVAL
jgi:Domain of unknown function (DUF4372)